MSKTLQEMTLDFQTRIQDLAYFMWEQAGRQQGMAVQYWLEAEKQALAAMHAATSHVMSRLEEAAAPVVADAPLAEEAPAPAAAPAAEPAAAATQTPAAQPSAAPPSPPPVVEEQVAAVPDPQPASAPPPAAVEEPLPPLSAQAVPPPAAEAAAASAKPRAPRKPAVRRKSKS